MRTQTAVCRADSALVIAALMGLGLQPPAIARAQPAPASPPGVAAEPQRDLEAEARALAAPLIESGAVPGLVIGLIDATGTDLRLGLGSIAADQERMPDSRTLFEIGSITKVFTGVLLAQMVEAGEVKTSTPVQSLLPEDVEVPVKGRPMVLGELATHTSGLPRLPDNIDLSPQHADDPYLPYNEALLLEFLRNTGPVRAPGAYEYSNLGAGLLGHLLAKRAGRPYGELLRERVLLPLGMNDARFGLVGDHGLVIAMPHAWGDEPSHPWTFDVVAPAGGLCAHLDDMLVFGRAAINPDLAAALDPAHAGLARAMSRAATPVEWVKPQPGVPKMGIGWHFDGKDRAWHNGGTGGFSSCMVVDRAHGRIAVVLANSAANHEVTTLGFQLADLLAGENPEPLKIRQAAVLTEAQVERWVGRYRLTPTIDVEVMREGTRAYTQLTGQDRLRLFAADERTGFLRVVEASLEFEFDEAGDASGSAAAVVLVQGGMRQRAPRIEAR